MTCQVCQYHISDNNAAVCPNCGAPLTRLDDIHDNPDTESRVDQQSLQTHPIEADGIEICDPGNFMGSDYSPEDSQETEEDIPPAQDEGIEPLPQSEIPESQINGGNLTHLSAKQAEEIRNSLLQNDSDEGVSLQDASGFLGQVVSETLQNNGDSDANENEKDNDENNDNKDELTPPDENNTQPEAAKVPEPQPITSDTTEEPIVFRTKTGGRHRVAYFHKKFILLTGQYQPVSGEELLIGSRSYLLKPKKLKQQHAYAIFGAVLILAMIVIGLQFISPTMPGHGSVIGVVLDQDGRPMGPGVTVTLPEVGESTVTNNLGFFRFEDISPGTYHIKFTTPEGKVLTDNVSVVDDELTMTALGNDWSKAYDLADKRLSNSKKTSQARAAAPQKQPPQVAQNPSPQIQKTKSSQYAALRLKTNADNPKLTASGEVLGRGNLVYDRLKPGRHEVLVTADGYKSWKGKVDLTANEIYTLNLNLESAQTPATTTAQTENSKPTAAENQFTANEYYEQGRQQLEMGNYAEAVSSFTEAINLKPSLADAYRDRATANYSIGQTDLAESDFVRAGEIYARQDRLGEAESAFDKALNINNQSVPALLDEANLCRRRDDDSKAIDIYKQILGFNDDNFMANLELGKTYFEIGKYKDADKKLRKAQKLDESNPEVYHLLMLNYFARNDFDKVKDTYADYTNIASDKEMASFSADPKYEAILRVINHK